MTETQQRSDVLPFPAASLPDLCRISIDRTLPVPERTRAFLKAVGDPYLFRVGDIVVKVSFNPNGRPFRDALADALDCG